MKVILTRNQLDATDCEGILLPISGQETAEEGIGRDIASRWPHAWERIQAMPTAPDHITVEPISVHSAYNAQTLFVVNGEVLATNADWVFVERVLVRLRLLFVIRSATDSGLRSLATPVLRAGFQLPLAVNFAVMIGLLESLTNPRMSAIDLHVCLPSAEDVNRCADAAKRLGWMIFDSDHDLHLIKAAAIGEVAGHA